MCRITTFLLRLLLTPWLHTCRGGLFFAEPRNTAKGRFCRHIAVGRVGLALFSREKVLRTLDVPLLCFRPKVRLGGTVLLRELRLSVSSRCECVCVTRGQRHANR